jgi:hypothetical protein
MPNSIAYRPNRRVVMAINHRFQRGLRRRYRYKTLHKEVFYPYIINGISLGWSLGNTPLNGIIGQNWGGSP